MERTFSPVRLTEALTRPQQHWEVRHEGEGGTGPAPRRPGPSNFTIALSREAGTYGAAIAREVGNRLCWPVYDSELLQHIADDLGTHGALLESVDERHVGWLSECLEGFSSRPAVSQCTYVGRLVKALLALAAHGECVIVGRGATKVLPLATTLRVRVVAPLDYRIEAVRREHGISAQEAARRVEATDRERDRFVRDHFNTNPADAHNYDLMLNVARFTQRECADLIIAALEQLRHRPGGSPAPHPAGATAAL